MSADTDKPLGLITEEIDLEPICAIAEGALANYIAEDAGQFAAPEVVRAVVPLIAAAVLRRAAIECEAISSGAGLGEFVPSAETWMRHRADQLEGEGER